MTGEITMTDYAVLMQQASALLEEEPSFVAAMSNLSALIAENLPDLNWAGFYLAAGEMLTVGPFQGKPACIHIPFGRGVCGTAAVRDETVLVPDVHLFPGHIACDSASRSEIVIPLHRDGKVAGVMDIDSPLLNRFTDADRKGLEQLAALMDEKLAY